MILTKLLTICGMWCLTDGWFSISMWAHDKRQTFWHDHYIRVIRIIVGIILIWIA